MAKTSTHKTPAFFNQDTYDKATIKAFHELQKIGFCRNITLVEEYLTMPKRSLLLALAGQRHIAKGFRSKLLQFLSNNYHVNPEFFQRLSAPLFKGNPPTLEEQQEPYFNQKGVANNVVSMGDFAEMERLKKELADKNAKIKELQKEVKYWRDLAQKALTSGRPAAKKTGHKNGQKAKK